MTPEQNKKVVQDAYAAFGRGDIPALLSTLTVYNARRQGREVPGVLGFARDHELLLIIEDVVRRIVAGRDDRAGAAGRPRA